MPKGMSRTRGVKKKVNPLVEHIADFSDIEYDNDDSLEIIDAHATQKRDDECEDETDRTWMYKNPGDEEIIDEDEVTDEDLWGDEAAATEPEDDKVTKQPERMRNESQLDQYMAAAVWFHDISERGEISDDELRYVELMLIEMSNFYFDNLKNINPSGKCLDSIKKIYRDIQEAGLCTKY